MRLMINIAVIFRRSIDSYAISDAGRNVNGSFVDAKKSKTIIQPCKEFIDVQKNKTKLLLNAKISPSFSLLVT